MVKVRLLILRDGRKTGNETTLSIEDIIVKCLRVISLKMGLI